ncbi:MULTISPECIES: hypothetical protein [unclassified Saccharothrix]|uniref:hypothetical protein n=1 Tax=unclassified Saccharothrix TaxID=2593673 RepID=UPI00307F1673
MTASTLAQDPDDDPRQAGAAGAELAEVVFTPAERWGWRFAPPAPPDEEPEDVEPRWQEPPELVTREEEHRRLLKRLPWMGAAGGIVSAGGVAAASAGLGVGGAVLSVFVVAGVAVKALLPLVERQSALRESRAQRQHERQVFEQQHAEWRKREDARDRRRRQHDAASRWFPVRLDAGTARVDVFGGGGAGWKDLITTVGSTVLRSGDDVLVVDFSEEDVGAGLAALARTAGLPVSTARLMQDQSLLQGLDPDEVVRVVAGAVASHRTPTEAADLRVVAAEVLTTVVECLDEPVTFARLSAALRVVRGHGYHGRTRQRLSLAEAGRLTGRIDLVGTTPRVADALQALAHLTELLAVDTETAPPSTWSGPGLTVLTSGGADADRKDFLDRVLFQRVVHALRTGLPGSGRDVLFVAGADRMGLDNLEALAKQAGLAKVRLVLLLEHLRGDLVDLLGTAGSAAILMRLGNADEAESAARFVGRRHRFEDTGTSVQTGTTLTESTSTSHSTQAGTSETEGTQRTTPRDAGLFDWRAGTKGTSSGVGTSESKTWSESTSQSIADAESTTTSRSRVYEYEVEPTVFQGLPPTGFVMVENGPNGRTVVHGDCDPRITLLRRVALEPRPGDA